jgi:hypothetical protein
VESGGGRIYSMYETLCMEDLSGYWGRGGVCMCTGMTNAIFYGNGDTDENTGFGDDVASGNIYCMYNMCGCML